MSLHHFLYVPIDREKAAKMEDCYGIDTSTAQGRIPDGESLRRDIEATYEGYEGGWDATEDGFNAHYTKCLGQHVSEGHLVGEYDDLTFEYSEGDFRESNLVCLGRHLPSRKHSLGAFLDLMEKHFGVFWIFDDAEMTLRDPKEIMESSS